MGKPPVNWLSKIKMCHQRPTPGSSFCLSLRVLGHPGGRRTANECTKRYRIGLDRDRHSCSCVPGFQLHHQKKGPRRRAHSGHPRRTPYRSPSSRAWSYGTRGRNHRAAHRTSERLRPLAFGAYCAKESEMKLWKLFLVCLLLPSSYVLAKPADDKAKDNDRIQNAGTVVQEILDVPDNIPQDVLDKARCVVVMPSVLKAAFIAGGSYGRGVMVCRTGKDYDGPWGAPAMYALEGGSFGLQIGGEATDFVILVMNNRGAESLLHSKVKLGADASVAAGPVGRQAEADTDATMRAEMLSYSRARGVFAGFSLEGTTLRPDNGGNRRLYHERVTAPEIVRESKVAPPESARTLLSALQEASPQLRS